MILPRIEIRQAESLGRNNLGAVGGLASAKGAYATAQANVLQNLAKVGGEFIRREETSLFNTAMANTHNSESQFIEKEGVKESFTGEELDGRVQGVELYGIGADQNGKEIKKYKKSIPAYKVYPQLLSKKLQGDMEVYAKTIPNPIDRKAYIENRSVDIAQKVRGATLKAAREQYQVVRDESDIRRDQALANGDIQAADIEATNFEGSEFEVKERLTENKQKMEIWTGDRLIQIEDYAGMAEMLDRLQDENYKKKGGPLPERPNIDLQNRLKRKLSSLDIRRGNIDRVYKEELRQRAQDFIKAQEDGVIKSSNEVDAMRQALGEVSLDRLSIDVRRAAKKAEFIDFMWKTPSTDHAGMINELLPEVAKGDKGVVFRNQLLAKSQQIERRQLDDATGIYQERNMSSAPNPSDPQFFAKSLASSKLAGEQYRVKAKPLTKQVAKAFSQKFKFATVKAKEKFIDKVLVQVPEKADQDALFTQIDKEGAGNLNVYADIIERGEKDTIKAIDEGKRLRQDSKLGLIPKGGIDGDINTALYQVFKLPIELEQYREAVKDYYAKLANDAGDREKEIVDPKRLTDSIEAVVGNIVKYDGRNFLLANNTLDADSFEDWIDALDYEYLDQLGGIMNMTAEEAMGAIREGDLTLYPSLTRGEYLLKDAKGMYLQKANTRNGTYESFKFIYDRNAPERTISIPFEGSIFR